MDLEYDTKFKEMKKYIPFLEGMIRRLESTKSSSSSNPRQAQLDKIRSLRDLLLDKRKRMKMVNLLKCEQVLVNLYAKVEQKDNLPGIAIPGTAESSRVELENVRNKLKSMSTNSCNPETLPEIARASETEAICTPGSKEPALFQRRPNLEQAPQPSPTKTSSKSPVKVKSNSKRSYTRVLVSPEPKGRWSESRDEISDKPLLSRRSPKKSPRRHSPFYHKKERKKSSRERDSSRRKDLNITLNVPQDSLDSLNTEDILSRIINCSDSDVDISTLRELRNQILGELQKTGASDDISDLILKSYKHKKKSAKKQEVEEGELSDSESEAIENVYGNLKVVEKKVVQSDVTDINKTKSNNNDCTQRKIQICLVFNSDKEAKTSKNVEENNKHEEELEMFHETNKDNPIIDENTEVIDVDKPSEVARNIAFLDKNKCSKEVVEKVPTQNSEINQLEAFSNIGFKANFYKPSSEDGRLCLDDVVGVNESLTNTSLNMMNSETLTALGKGQNIESLSNPTNLFMHPRENKAEEIPLLGNDSRTVDMTSALSKKSTDKVSEIDILQALKNEILGETIPLPNSQTTPSLHQPKLIKVSNAQEITKKRISIEKYKAKGSNIYNSNLINPLTKKTSLNLTEKECERFNFSKIALDDSSDEETKSTDITVEDVYRDFAPKSPDCNSTFGIITSPVIIPDEPTHDKLTNFQNDVDMRKPPLLPSLSGAANALNTSVSGLPQNSPTVQSREKTQRPVDPRMRKEIQRSVSRESPNPYILNSDKNHTFSKNSGYSNMNSSRAPSMTPSRAPSMTPSHQTFEIDVPSKHVYAPLLSNPDIIRENSDINCRRRPIWENIKDDPAECHNNRSRGNHIDNGRPDISPPKPSFGRSDMPMTPLPLFGRSEMPMTPSHSFGRSEIPMTPTHPFGYSELPMTPSHSFGRGETPMTPSHPFGRSDMPMTPSHPFSRGDMPMTPSHPFSRGDKPMTPSHPFSRGDKPMTPSHPIGRNESQTFGRNDPRLNRSEKEKYNRDKNLECEKDYGRFVREKSIGRTNQGYQRVSIKDDSFRREKSVCRNETDQQYEGSSQYNRYYRERSVARNEIDQQFETSYSYNRFNREKSVGRNESDTREQIGRQYQREPIKEPFSSNNSHLSDHPKTYERQTQRGRSVDRNAWNEQSRFGRSSEEQQTKDNLLSVEPKTGRSFIIDTSVNKTFQNNVDPIALLAERRRRAVSVGKTLTREPSVGRMDDFNQRRQRASSVGRTLKHNNYSLIENKFEHSGHSRKDFRRCNSVGRDLKNTCKSFNDIKAEFTLYQKKENADSKKKYTTFKNSYSTNNERNPRTKETLKLNQSTNYSPRQNYRDPRMRKDQQLYDKRNKHDKYRKNSFDRSSGIVYSNDNIAKGAILGPGYGVKNYKIPKIKRPVEELKGIDTSSSEPLKDIKETKKVITKSNNDDTLRKKESMEPNGVNQDEKTKKSKKNETKVQGPGTDSDTKCEKATKSAKSKRNTSIKSKSTNVESALTSRKYKKAVIYDSDSDSEEKIKQNKSQQNEDKSEDATLEQRDDEEEVLFNNSEVLESSFCIEDMDIFNENMVSDSNINAILADLDNDISTNKNIVEKNVQNDSDKQLSSDQALTEIPQLIEEELNHSTQKPKVVEQLHSQILSPKTADSCSSVTELQSTGEKKKIENVNSNDADCLSTPLNVNKLHPTNTEITPKESCQSETINTNAPNLTPQSAQKTQLFNSDAIVSTSDVEASATELEGAKGSIPDSTSKQASDISKKSEQDRLPDSTNEINNETSVDISSTLKDEMKATSSKDTIDSFGNLITILQDKTKIKQLLSMLGEQGIDNEKIKKKLEKISEIVSDDEDTKDSLNQSETAEKIRSTTLLHHIEKVDPIKDSTQIMKTENSKVSSPASLSDKGYENNQPQAEKMVGMTPVQDSKISASPKKAKIPTPQNKKTGKFLKQKKVPAIKAKRITRSTLAGKGKKKRGELQKLQDDIKEMFYRDEILNASGIRMCRLAKMLDGKTNKKEDKTSDTISQESEPKVVLEKMIEKEVLDAISPVEKSKRKPGPKSKMLEKEQKLKPDMPSKLSLEKDRTVSYRPGPKSKTKNSLNVDTPDPYAFETESASTSIASLDNTSENSSDSENESLASAKSYGSNEPIIDLKKKKRKRRGWKAGVIKTKPKKKKPTEKHPGINKDNKQALETDVQSTITTPDMNCFTDKKYCFLKDITTYSCRLCKYEGDEIVHHYKKNHPHSEVPLSRMHPDIAKKAIQQCEEVNFQTISKLPTDKYICRFCFKEFAKKKNILEVFFWHIVSVHTGEYKQVCTECVNYRHCPFNLDIPPPPKDLKGQLIGYICDKCNFTQISLENLKLHVILRHNDEQTAVYTINLANMTEETINELTKRLDMETEKSESRVLRSRPSFNTTSESSPNKSEDMELAPKSADAEQATANTFQTRISFENDDTSEVSGPFNEGVIAKVKHEAHDPVENASIENSKPLQVEKHSTANDIVASPHFKVNFTSTGTKEYVCCIHGNLHYRTPLLISFRKHVQKHEELWDGYCIVCKVIVTPIGKHSFKELLQHFIDNHMDDFPVEEDIAAAVTEVTEKEASAVEPASRTYINVRPLAELLSTSSIDPEVQSEGFPVIKNVMSLGVEPVVTPPIVDPPQLSPGFTYNNQTTSNNAIYVPVKYEEAQAEVMSKKYKVVLDAMMVPDKLVRLFKCAGRYCSFSTDSTEQALVHASTHERVGGENALKCSYCDFDSTGNAIDLVMHVFKLHAHSFFACGHCFYRAAAPQLVGAHITRLHGGKDPLKSVFKSTRPLPPTPEDSTMRELKREEACLYYVCNNGFRNMSIPCKFKTFTPGKFIDHLQHRHPSDNVYSCYLCSEDFATPDDLVSHLKTHGLKRYQCLWCVFGAEDEPELLAHASEKHPWKLPQGYLRIVTNKDGSDEYRVLPKALLNKNKVPFKEINPNAAVENAEREAERSIDLEKLIGNLLTLAGCSTTEVVSEPSVVAPVPEAVTEIPALMEVADQPDHNVPSTVIRDLSVTNPADTPDLALKTEVIESPANNSEVICLDSDEDEPTQVKIISTKLFRCAKCKNLCKTLTGFKKHIYNCYKGCSDDISCIHCAKKIKDCSELLVHLVKEHSIGDKYVCSLCTQSCTSHYSLKKHMKVVHFVDKPVIRTQYKDTQIVNYAMDTPGQVKSKVQQTIKKYGPQDINKLPLNFILDELVYCAICEFNTKVRLNMVRHLQLHAEQQPVAQTAPVNPVPHLETNEKYFDKMLNLASSSINNPKSKKQEAPVNAQVIPSEAALRYPKYIPDRQRYACGAKDCSYISVDEGMFKCHWETLHNGVNEFTCLHCPPNQHLDPSKPLSALRIIAHLKMHDSCLYACSSCPYYHFKYQILEKHINENHSKKGSQVMIVRDENTATSTSPGQASTSQPPNAPTMDLKPWQCGLCQFKTMLRHEINDHCYKVHQSKMQFKCSHCPYRASTIENVGKHQKNSHSDKDEDIFYFYYREGSIPNEADGTPRWIRQRQKTGITDTEVKTETSEQSSSKSSQAQKEALNPPPTILIPKIDLNIVKQEIDNETEHSLESLCARFSQFCEPNGIKFKCPLCKVIYVDTKEAMQSHLYEELGYRKWACSICAYKAFHKTGLTDHMTSEHKQIRDPVELPKDVDIEVWVAKLIDHQTSLIEKNKEKLYAQLNIQTPVESSKVQHVEKPKEISIDKNKYDNQELEKAFGQFGEPKNMQFSCPKCQFKAAEADIMQDHLESELTKIRWCCNNCSKNFQTYHEAQFHCRTAHPGVSAWPTEAMRDATVRLAWIAAVIASQKSNMNCVPETTPSTSRPPNQLTELPDAFDNSLLAVRYEERVPTPEQTMQLQRKRPANEYDSEEENLVIDELENTPQESSRYQKFCPLCNFKASHHSAYHNHLVKHYNLKPITCSYCDYSDYKSQILAHLSTAHPNHPKRFKNTVIPNSAGAAVGLGKKKENVDKSSLEDGKLFCLICEKQVHETETSNHLHTGHTTQQFAKKGDVVVKCGECLVLRKDITRMEHHFASDHKDLPLNYAYFKIKTTNSTSRGVYQCGHCDKRFPYLMDLRNHHTSLHRSLQLSFTTESVSTQSTPAPTSEASLKRKSSDPTCAFTPKKTARKSTTKLPKVVARKSTTKLPMVVESTDMNLPMEVSSYGTKPAPMDQYESVTLLMPFCNTIMPFKLKQLSEILKIHPLVLVKDLYK